MIEPVKKLTINTTATAVEQFEQLKELIATVPPRHPSLILTFTPELAALILEHLNSGNRRQRPSNIKRFAAAMSVSGWILTGDTIKFSEGGVLSDGQNRMKASVRSGMPFETHVVFSVPNAAFSKIDANAVRNNPDTFHIAGIEYNQIVAPAVRHILIGQDRSRQVENQELLDYYRREIDADVMKETARISTRVGSRTVPLSILTACLYQFQQKNPRMGDKLAIEFEHKRGAALVYLKKIGKLKSQQMGRLHENVYTALLIQTWNVFKSGKKLTAAMLNWNENKDFPEIE